jgi:hypothetical protein
VVDEKEPMGSCKGVVSLFLQLDLGRGGGVWGGVVWCVCGGVTLTFDKEGFFIRDDFEILILRQLRGTSTPPGIRIFILHPVPSLVPPGSLG